MRLLGVAAGVLLALALCEVSIRVFGWSLRRDVAVDHDESHKVIYCIGDSFTYGQGLSPSEAYPFLLQQSLDEALGQGRVEVQNLGEPGASSSHAKARVHEALAAGNAAVLLVWTGWNVNDNDIRWYREKELSSVPWRERAEALIERSALYRVLRQAATYRRRTIELEGVDLVPPSIQMDLYDFRDYQEICLANLREIVRLARAAGVPLVLLDYPHQELPPNPFTKNELYHLFFGRRTPLTAEDYIVPDRRPDEIAIHSVIRWVAQTEGVPLIDLQEVFQSSGRSDLFQPADWHHPTAAGARIVAAAVHDALVGPLREALDRRDG